MFWARTVASLTKIWHNYIVALLADLQAQSVNVLGHFYIIDHCIGLFVVTMTDVEAQQHYDEFFEEVFVELDEKVGILSLLIIVATFYKWPLQMGFL